jgi:hypothetical protein
MAVPNIRIDIASVFKEKGFKDASKASSSLETQFKRLGKTFLTVFSAAAIVKFGKDSVRAFAEEEKAAKRLEQTLKGVNLGFTTPAVEAYLKQLEDSTFVADDLLRPALEKLVRTTGSVTASQDLLATAIDMSAGSGVDLVTVANDLGRAYLGNARGLAKYNTSLTRADLQTKSFSEIQKVLNDQFSGQRAAYLTTYAGRLDMINTSYGNMQEAIGEGLVDAFGMLAGDSGISGATSAMEEFGTISADVIRGIGSLLGNLTSQFGGSGGLQNIIDLGAKMNNPLGTALKSLQNLGAANRPLQFPTLGIGQPGYAAQQKAIEDAAAKRAKQAEALRLKEIKQREKVAKLKKLSNQLDKAATKFDEKRIQIAAALQGRISEEERKRLQELLLIEETKAAIQEGDLETAEKLFEKLTKLQGQTEALAESLIDLEAGDPFENWDEYFEKAEKLLDGLVGNLKGVQSQIGALLTDTQARSAAAAARVIAAKEEKSVAYQVAAAQTATIASVVTEQAITAQIQATQQLAAASTPEERAAAEAFLEGANAALDAAAVLTESVIAAEEAAALAEADLAQELENQAFAALMDAGLAPTINVEVNVAGNITAEQDLIQNIQNGLYLAQRAGTNLVLRSVAL